MKFSHSAKLRGSVLGRVKYMLIVPVLALSLAGFQAGARADDETHVLSGYVFEADSSPAANVTLSFINSDYTNGGEATTDANGFYSVALLDGVYQMQNIGVLNDSQTNYINFYYLNPSGFGPGYDITTSDASSQDITLPAMTTISVAFDDGHGHPAAFDKAEFGFWSQTTNNSGLLIGGSPASTGQGYSDPDSSASYFQVDPDENGLATFSVPVGTQFSSGYLCAYYDELMAESCNSSPVTVIDDTTVTLHME